MATPPPSLSPAEKRVAEDAETIFKSHYFPALVSATGLGMGLAYAKKVKGSPAYFLVAGFTLVGEIIGRTSGRRAGNEHLLANLPRDSELRKWIVDFQQRQSAKQPSSPQDSSPQTQFSSDIEFSSPSSSSSPSPSPSDRLSSRESGFSISTPPSSSSRGTGGNDEMDDNVKNQSVWEKLRSQSKPTSTWDKLRKAPPPPPSSSSSSSPSSSHENFTKTREDTEPHSEFKRYREDWEKSQTDSERGGDSSGRASGNGNGSARFPRQNAWGDTVE